MIRLARTASAAAVAGLLTALLMYPSGCRQPDDTDTVRPYIRIYFPQTDVTVLDDIATVRAEARDNVGIKQVVFMAEGDTLASLSAEPYVLYWNTTAYPDCTDADSYVLLTASAEDFAGNSRSTHRQFYLDNEGNPPIPVELLKPTDVTKHSVTLSWEQSVDYYFSHYLLRRDVTSKVTGDSDSLARINGPDTTSFTDQDTSVSPYGLLENTVYYYRIWVYDEFDSSSATDSVVSARTLLPRPVTLSATATLTKYTVGLEWEASTEDVDYYRLHRGPSPQLAKLDSIARLPEGTHSYLDTDQTANTTYYYYLYLIDDAGYTHAFHSDDVLEVRTLALPQPVLEDPARVVTKYSATIAWETIEEQEDSSWVALYRSTAAAVDSTDLLLYTAPCNASLTHTDSPLQQGQTYRYRLHHRDSQDNTAWSNILALTTRTLADVWSGGLGYSQGKYQLDLTWDRYSYTPTDFAGYTLSRDGVVIRTFPNAADNRYTDTGLAKNTTYLYGLAIADTSGASVAISMEARTRDILPAEIVNLEATADWSYDLAWLPSREPDLEFDRYELLRSNDTEEIFEDNDGDNTADCLSGNCVQVTILPQHADTIKYMDDDATLVATTMRDTIRVDTSWVNTTLMDTTQVDTMWVDTTWVDDTTMVITPMDSSWVDTTWVDTTLMVITEVDTTVIDTTLPVFNYVVLTYDVAGEYVRSNIVGDTLKPPPTAVTLSGPSEHGEVSDRSIKIQWTGAPWPSPPLGEWLFSRYEIWRFMNSEDKPWEAGGSDPLAQITDIDATTYSDGSAEVPGRFWYYAVVVRDIFGQGAPSNVVEGYTK